MPELPEVETVRRSLLRAIIGRTVRDVSVRRSDVIDGPRDADALLRGRRVSRIDRLGKELSIVGERDGVAPRCVCIHLGMSGSLRWVGRDNGFTPDQHVHVIWTFDDGGRLAFRDPRRFGGVWPFACVEQRDRERWHGRGVDALTITAGQLRSACRGERAIKALLLDQSRLAGVGNIYADEALFASGIHPLTPAGALADDQVQRLATILRQTLRRAIEAGGSTLRDGMYVNGDGDPGRFQMRHKVYGRAGQPCRRCRATLQSIALSARTTVFCPRCQGTAVAA